MTTTQTPSLLDLRRQVSHLADVLVHDCDLHSESCHCFGQVDVDAYEAARAELKARLTVPRDTVAEARRLAAQVWESMSGVVSVDLLVHGFTLTVFKADEAVQYEGVRQ